ncbi:MAG: queuosine precursor transporter, partial [bacterium]|nr:queuosine precursor transporter [bacterium]
MGSVKHIFSSIHILSFCHIVLLTFSNVLVQYPFELFGFHTTWGAFTYPAIFILTDLTTRIASAQKARRIVFLSMIPGLIISYYLAGSIESSSHDLINNLFVIHILPLRIALASFFAYLFGQLLDIYVFQHIRNNNKWYLAPILSTTVGNLFDTLLFFTIAFYHCGHSFLSAHWPEIAL